MPWVGFEPMITASERASERASENSLCLRPLGYSDQTGTTSPFTIYVDTAAERLQEFVYTARLTNVSKKLPRHYGARNNTRDYIGITWLNELNFAKKKKKKKSVRELYRTSGRRLTAKLVPTFADRGWRVISATDAHGR
jgi:hypothetical protein